jgi:hypothetical protein
MRAYGLDNLLNRITQTFRKFVLCAFAVFNAKCKLALEIGLFTRGRSSEDSNVWQSSSAVRSAETPRMAPMGCGFGPAMVSMLEQ